MKFHLLEPGAVPWSRLDAYGDRTVFQTREWLDFVAETQRATPVIAELRDGDGAVAGYFSGLTFHRFGVKILGSSFPGWTTPYMAFNLEPGVARRQALEALEHLAFEDLRCLHLEVCDREFAIEDGQSLGYALDYYETFHTDLTPSEPDILKTMSENCRWAIRKSAKTGLRIEEAGPEGFAEDFYAQLQEVFQKQGKVPTYDIGRVHALIKHLLPTGRLLLLRVRDPEGNCIATGLCPGMNRVGHFWATASFRAGQNLRPNEALRWYALRYWKARGMQVFDWGGGGGWKEKFGPVRVFIPRFRKSRYKVISALREEAQKLVSVRQRLLGSLHGDPHSSDN